MKAKFLILFICLFIFTGCNSNELVCEKKEKKAGYDYEEKYELLYDKKGELLKKVILSTNSKYNELYTEEEIEKIYLEASKNCENHEKENNKIKCSVKRKGNEVNTQINIDVDKISENLFEDILYVTKKEFNNLKNSKKILENVGYKCK